MDKQDGRDKENSRARVQRAPTYAKAYGVACKRLKN